MKRRNFLFVWPCVTFIFVTAIPISNSVDPGRVFKFPLYPKFQNQQLYSDPPQQPPHVRNDDKAVSFPLKPGTTLNAMRKKCKDYTFIEIEDCEKFFCFNESYPVDYFKLQLLPEFQSELCPTITKGVPGAFQARGNNDVVIHTIYNVKEIDSDILPLGYHFCGCISAEIVHIFEEEDKIKGDSSSHADSFILKYNISERALDFLNLNSDVKFRTWDIGRGCESTWYLNLGLTAPATENFKDYGFSLFSKKDCSSIWADNEPWDEPTQIEKRFFQDRPFCVGDLHDLEELNAQPYPNSAGKSQCLKDGKGYDMVLVSKKFCYGINYEDMYPSLSLPDTEECLPCDDDPEYYCGTDEMFSIYYNKKIKMKSTYLGCAYNYLLNEPSLHMDPDLFVQRPDITSGPACVKECSKTGHQLAFVSTKNDSPDVLTNCTCATYYKLSERDIYYPYDNCYQSWCPGLDGPCSAYSHFSAVYCLSEDCDQSSSFTRMEDNYNICELGQDFPDPFKKDSNVRYVCRRNKETGRMSIVKELAENCRTVDSQGTLWVGSPNQMVTMDCVYGYSGSQSWFCQSNGEFDGSDPDRSDCVEDWIDDVYAKIENKTIPALEIAREMETELLGTELSKKGLLLISQALDDLLSVRLLQVPNDTDVNYNYNFVNTFTGNQEKMFTMESTWSNFTQEQTSNVTTSLINAGNRGAFIFLSVEIVKEELNSSDAFLVDFNYEGGFMSTAIRIANRAQSGKIFYEAFGAKLEIPGNIYDVISGSDYSGEFDFGENLAFVATGYNFTSLSDRFPQSKDDPETVFGVKVDFTFPYEKQVEFVNDQNVKLSFAFEKELGDPTCVFWDTETYAWSDEGCQVVEDGPGSVRCECNHLTTFSLIFGNFDDAPPYFLDILSQVLGALSITGLLSTQLFLFYNKPMNGLKTTVELNRNLSLLMAHLLFIFITDLKAAKDHPGICTAITFLTHAMWLAVFGWTALEGYLIYRALVTIFDTGSRRLYPLYAVGYGLPLAFASTTIAIAKSGTGSTDPETCYGYCDQNICWLHNYYVFGFLGPVAFVILFNIVVLVTGLKNVDKAMESRGRSDLERAASLARNCLILTFLLGITWSIGFVKFVPDIGVWIDIAFICLNASSGIFIFVYTVLLSRSFQVVSRKIMKRTSTFGTKISSVRFPRQRKLTKSTVVSLGNVHSDNRSSGYESDGGSGSAEDSSRGPDRQTRPKRSRKT